jgi:hypothetical protein
MQQEDWPVLASIRTAATAAGSSSRMLAFYDEGRAVARISMSVLISEQAKPSRG